MWTVGSSSPIYLGKEQVAEIIKDKIFGYVIRNKRPNGTIGVCFSSADLADIRVWLDTTYPGWKKDRRLLRRSHHA